MDCSCGCLARMVPIAEACVYFDGLELTESKRRSQLSCLLTTNRGFRPTSADLQESWKLPSTIRFATPSSVKLILQTVDKNGYAYMQADYHIASDDCINITADWKDFVSQNGFEAREVAMVMFNKEEDSLKFGIFGL